MLINVAHTCLSTKSIAISMVFLSGRANLSIMEKLIKFYTRNKFVTLDFV